MGAICYPLEHKSIYVRLIQDMVITRVIAVVRAVRKIGLKPVTLITLITRRLVRHNPTLVSLVIFIKLVI